MADIIILSILALFSATLVWRKVGRCHKMPRQDRGRCDGCSSSCANCPYNRQGKPPQTR